MATIASDRCAPRLAQRPAARARAPLPPPRTPRPPAPAEPARAAILIALLDGRALTAGELALTTDVSAQSASAHLSKLVDGGLLSVQPGGRHRYYKLADPEIARALEALGAISTRQGRPLALHSPADHLN